MLAFSGDGFINIKVSDFPVYRQNLQVSVHDLNSISVHEKRHQRSTLDPCS